MAAKLIQYYTYVESIKGLAGKMELATQTKVPSTKAALEQDTPELLERFRVTVAAITGKPAPQY